MLSYSHDNYEAKLESVHTSISCYRHSFLTPTSHDDNYVLFLFLFIDLYSVFFTEFLRLILRKLYFKH